MFMNERRIDVILKGSLFIIWIATVSTNALAIKNDSADSLSHKTASLTQTPSLANNASGKIAPNATTNNNRSVSTKPPTTKLSRFLDDYGELPGVPKDDDEDTFVNATVQTTTVRIPTQEKGEVNAFLSGARPSVDGVRNRDGETEGTPVANKSSEVLEKSLPSEIGSVNRTSSSNAGKNSTTKTGSVKQVAPAGTNSTKLPATKDFKFSNKENLSKVPNDKDKRLSTTNKTATVKTAVHQKAEANASLSGAHPPVENKQKPTVKNGTKTNTVRGASKANVSQHAGGLNTSKTLSTTQNVTGNGTKPLKKVTVTPKLKINSTAKPSKSNTTSSAYKDRRDNASDAKTISSNRNTTKAENQTATKHSTKDVSLKTGVSNSTSVKANVSRIVASIQSSKPSVAASNAKSTGNITMTKNQTSKALKFESVLKIGKSNTTHGKSKDKDSVKHKNQPAPTSNTADAGSNKKAKNQTSEISKTNKTLKADKSVTTSNVTKAKTSSAGNVKSNKTLTLTSNITGTNDTNKAKKEIPASLKLKNTQTLNKTNTLSIISKVKESNIVKLNKSPANATTKTTKTNNQTSATLTLKSVLKIGESNSKTSVTEDKGSNAGNIKKQPETTSSVNGTGSSSKTVNRTSATSKIEAALKASISNTPSKVAKVKNAESPKGNKPSVKTSNTTVTDNTSRTKDHTPAAESIKTSSKGGKLNVTSNALKDKGNTLGNTKKGQSVINLKMTATGKNISKTSNQTSTTLNFKSILKTKKSNTTSDLTKDKGNSSGNGKSNNSVKSDKIFPATSSAKDKDKTTKTNNQTSETLIFKRNIVKADR